MAPTDSRKEVRDIRCAKAEAVSRDAKRIYGVLLSETWLQGTVLEVINHKPDNAKRNTTYIRAKYKIGNKEYEKSIPLQSLKACAPDGVPTCATAQEAGVLRNENANPPQLDNNNNNGQASTADSRTASTTTPPSGMETPSPPPLGGGDPPYSTNAGCLCQ